VTAKERGSSRPRPPVQVLGGPSGALCAALKLCTKGGCFSSRGTAQTCVQHTVLYTHHPSRVGLEACLVVRLTARKRFRNIRKATVYII